MASSSPSRSAVEPSPHPRQTYRLAFHGNGTSFFLIFLKNVLLSLVTLGLYFAWAKVARRRYVWSHLSLHDQPLRYTATGLELFKGYAIVIAAYASFALLPELLGLVLPWGAEFTQVVLALGFIAVTPLVIYRSRAFLYNRTAWRGIRFGLAPRSWEYAKTFWIGWILMVPTLGLYWPVLSSRLHRALTDNTRFGSLELRYTGRDRDAFWLGVKGFLLTLLTLGLYWFWYRAELRRYRFAHTWVGGAATLHSDLRGSDLLKLFLLSVVGTTLTLGLAFPWITMYSIRVVAERTTVTGSIDFAAVEQQARDVSAASEGFADAFDVEFGL